MTRATFGQLFIGSSQSVGLQRSLASKLVERLDGLGSPLYALTWKRSDMPSGPPICALRASARRTSGSGCIGWPMPKEQDSRGGDAANKQGGPGLATVAGWPTPSAAGFEATDTDRLRERRAECKERTGNGNGFGLTLGQAVPLYMAGWPTPKASGDTNDTPEAKTARVAHSGLELGVAARSILGPTPNTSPAPTVERGQLNPEFVRWLMGFPPEHLSCAPTVTRSSRK